MKKLISVILAAVLVFSSASFAAATSESSPARDGVGMSISGFTTQDFAQNAIDDSILSNATVTVFNIWATWCGPCLGEMPDFQLLHEYYEATPEADVQLYSVLYDEYGDNFTEAVEVIASNGYTWPQLLMFNEMYSVADSLGNYIGLPVPQTIIVDSTGTVRAHKLGRFWDYDDMYAYINGWYETISAEQPPVPPTEPPIVELPGDMDGDGSLSVSDAVIIVRIAMGLISVENSDIADVDGNGTVNVSDAVLVLRTALGL